MKFFRTITDFIIYSNLFIAGCAVLMVVQTFRFVLHLPADWIFIGFVFSATLCSYSFHWYLTDHSVIPSPRINWLRKFRFVHIILFFTGTVGVIYFSLQLLPHWPWLLVSALIAFLYSAPKIPHPLFRSLRKWALGKTIFLAFAWMFVTSWLPAVVSEEPWTNQFTLFCIYRFFQVYCICILFDYRDRQDDKADGIRSLITYLDDRNITRLFIFSTIASLSAALALYKWDADILFIACLLLPVLITAAFYNRARRNFSDLFYYGFLDGLMALSAILMLVARI